MRADGPSTKTRSRCGTTTIAICLRETHHWRQRDQIFSVQAPALPHHNIFRLIIRTEMPEVLYSTGPNKLIAALPMEPHLVHELSTARKTPMVEAVDPLVVELLALSMLEVRVFLWSLITVENVR